MDASGAPLYEEVCEELKSEATMERWVLHVLGAAATTTGSIFSVY